MRPRGDLWRSGQRWDADDVDDVPMVELPRQPAADAGIPPVTVPIVDLHAEELITALEPVVVLPAVDATPPPPDRAALDAATRSTRDDAASQWDLAGQMADVPVWQPDPAARQLRAVQPAPAAPLAG